VEAKNVEDDEKVEESGVPASVGTPRLAEEEEEGKEGSGGVEDDECDERYLGEAGGEEGE
jgi:hypothetical protein